jgi:hypothetical protein
VNGATFTSMLPSLTSAVPMTGITCSGSVRLFRAHG